MRRFLSPFRRRLLKPSAALIAAGLISALAPMTPVGAASGHEQIDGSGSSWAAVAVNQWVTDVSNRMQVVYTPSGSATGRTDYANGVTDYAVSDIGYQGQNPITGGNDASNRPYAYLPIVGGATAFAYNLTVAGQQVQNLRLSGLTLAKIFTDQISNWDDPAITADNNGHQFPSIPIIPVIHSEGAGTTFHFTDWLNNQYPSEWQSFSGYHFPVEFWPTGKGSQVSENGSDGVMGFISSAAGNGSIGYDEYAYAIGAHFPVVALENSAGYFTMPDAYDAAVALTQAQINYTPGPDYLLESLNNVYTYSDPRTYPLSSYSYEILPTAATCSGPINQCDPTMNTAKRQTLADFDSYSLCQGQSEMAPIGYSPLPINLVQASFKQVSLLKSADAGVSLSNVDISSCNNPTFIPGQPQVNHLAQIAPYPPSCAKSGQGPCAGQYAHNGNPVGGQAAGITPGGNPHAGGLLVGGQTGRGTAGGGKTGGGSAGAGGSSAGAGSAGSSNGVSTGGSSGGSAGAGPTTGAGKSGTVPPNSLGNAQSLGGNTSNGNGGGPSTSVAPQAVPTVLATAHPGGIGDLAIAIAVALLIVLGLAVPVMPAVTKRVPGRDS